MMSANDDPDSDLPTEPGDSHKVPSQDSGATFPTHDADPWSKASFTPIWADPPTEPYELHVPTLQKGKAYDVDTIMRHASFGLLCWFLDNEYPGHVVWDPAEVQEMTELRTWWESHWNMEPMNNEAYDEIMHMHHRLVEISMRLWV